MIKTNSANITECKKNGTRSIPDLSKGTFAPAYVISVQQYDNL